MSILTRIHRIPLFNNQQKAIEWGRQFGLEGFHTHPFQDQTGYMAGSSHNQAIQAFDKGPQVIKQTVSKSPQVVRQASSPRTSSGGGGGY